MQPAKGCYVRSIFQCATLGLMVLTRVIFYFKFSLSGDLCSNNSTMYYPVQMESVLKDSWSWKFKIEYYFSSAWVVDVIFDVVYKMNKRHREQMFRRNLSSTSCLEAYETTKGWGLSEGFEAASVCLDRQMAIDDGSFYISHIGSCSTDVIDLIILHKPD